MIFLIGGPVAVKGAIRPLGDTRRCCISNDVVVKECENFVRSVRAHQVERIGAGIGDIDPIGKSQDSVRIRIREITRREVEMKIRPCEIEVANIGDIANLAP